MISCSHVDREPPALASYSCTPRSAESYWNAAAGSWRRPSGAEVGHAPCVSDREFNTDKWPFSRKEP